jgi:hypothetical protein
MGELLNEIIRYQQFTLVAIIIIGIFLLLKGGDK